MSRSDFFSSNFSALLPTAKFGQWELRSQNTSFIEFFAWALMRATNISQNSSSSQQHQHQLHGPGWKCTQQPSYRLLFTPSSKQKVTTYLILQSFWCSFSLSCPNSLKTRWYCQISLKRSQVWFLKCNTYTTNLLKRWDWALVFLVQVCNGTSSNICCCLHCKTQFNLETT